MERHVDMILKSIRFKPRNPTSVDQMDFVCNAFLPDDHPDKDLFKKGVPPTMQQVAFLFEQLEELSVKGIRNNFVILVLFNNFFKNFQIFSKKSEKN